MTEIRFYHVTTQTLEQAIPAILTKAYGQERKSVVLFGDSKDMIQFDETLWVAKPDGFLPHGTQKDDYPDLQPIYLTTKAENPNKADLLAMCDIYTVPENISDFSLVCDFLNGRDDDSIAAGRVRWKTYKDAGHSVTYWQQGDTGGWEQKA
jgi:DNA polymerase-3 subunit chi